jgi:hypothetical protein
VHRGQQMTDYACVTSTPCSPIIFTQANDGGASAKPSPRAASGAPPR